MPQYINGNNNILNIKVEDTDARNKKAFHLEDNNNNIINTDITNLYAGQNKTLIDIEIGVDADASIMKMISAQNGIIEENYQLPADVFLDFSREEDSTVVTGNVYKSFYDEKKQEWTRYKSLDFLPKNRKQLTRILIDDDGIIKLFYDDNTIDMCMLVFDTVNGNETLNNSVKKGHKLSLVSLYGGNGSSDLLTRYQQKDVFNLQTAYDEQFLTTDDIPIEYKYYHPFKGILYNTIYDINIDETLKKNLPMMLMSLCDLLSPLVSIENKGVYNKFYMSHISKNQEIVVPSGVSLKYYHPAGTLAFSCQKNLSGEVVVPFWFGGYHSRPYFHNRPYITSIKFADKNQLITENSFSGCTALESIDPINLILPRQSFLDCSSLKNIDLSNCLFMGLHETFQNCSELETIIYPSKRLQEIPEGTPSYDDKQDDICRKAYLIDVPEIQKEKENGDICDINDEASGGLMGSKENLELFGFDDMEENVEYQNSGGGDLRNYKRYDRDAYANVSSYERKWSTFENCQKMTSFNFKILPLNICEISLAFANTGITSLSDSDFNTNEPTKLGGGTFRGCQNLEQVSLTYPTIIGNSFNSCDKLQSINLPRVTSAYGFSNLPQLITLNIPNLKVVNGFDNLPKLTTLNLPNLTTARHFSNMPKLTTLNIPNLTTMLGGIPDSGKLIFENLGTEVEGESTIELIIDKIKGKWDERGGGPEFWIENCNLKTLSLNGIEQIGYSVIGGYSTIPFIKNSKINNLFLDKVSIIYSQIIDENTDVKVINLPSLKILSFDWGFGTVCFGGNKFLKEINIGNPNDALELDWGTSQYFIDSCSNLETLNINSNLTKPISYVYKFDLRISNCNKLKNISIPPTQKVNYYPYKSNTIYIENCPATNLQRINGNHIKFTNCELTNFTHPGSGIYEFSACDKLNNVSYNNQDDNYITIHGGHYVKTFNIGGILYTGELGTYIGTDEEGCVVNAANATSISSKSTNVSMGDLNFTKLIINEEACRVCVGSKTSKGESEEGIVAKFYLTDIYFIGTKSKVAEALQSCLNYSMDQDARVDIYWHFVDSESAALQCLNGDLSVATNLIANWMPKYDEKGEIEDWIFNWVPM